MVGSEFMAQGFKIVFKNHPARKAWVADEWMDSPGRQDAHGLELFRVGRFGRGTAFEGTYKLPASLLYVLSDMEGLSRRIQGQDAELSGGVIYLSKEDPLYREGMEWSLGREFLGMGRFIVGDYTLLNLCAEGPIGALSDLSENFRFAEVDKERRRGYGSFKITHGFEGFDSEAILSVGRRVLDILGEHVPTKVKRGEEVSDGKLPLITGAQIFVSPCSRAYSGLRVRGVFSGGAHSFLSR